MNSTVLSKQRTPAGFTLIELLLYLGVTAAMIGVILLVAVASAGVRLKTLAQHEVNYSARFAMEKITQEIRRASAINAGSSTFGSSPGILSLAMDDAAEDPTIIDVSGGALRIKRGASATVDITTPKADIINFTISNLSSGTKVRHLKLSITAKHENLSNIGSLNASITTVSSINIRKKHL